MRFHPVVPGGAIGGIEATVTRSINRTPFGHEHREAAVHCRDRICTFGIGVMRAGIKVESVSGVVLGVRNGSARGVIRILVPATASHHDQVVRVLANRLHHSVCVGLDGTPSHSL